jgi:hypothetical protein
MATMPAQEAPLRRVVGSVVEARANRAIAGATVRVEASNTDAVSNAIGRFVLDGLVTGNTVIGVDAPGYLELRVPQLQVTAGQTLEVEVEFEPTPSILQRIQVTATKSALSIGEVPAQTDIGPPRQLLISTSFVFR